MRLRCELTLGCRVGRLDTKGLCGSRMSRAVETGIETDCTLRIIWDCVCEVLFMRLELAQNEVTIAVRANAPVYTIRLVEEAI